MDSGQWTHRGHDASRAGLFPSRSHPMDVFSPLSSRGEKGRFEEEKEPGATKSHPQAASRRAHCHLLGRVGDRGVGERLS